MEFNEIHLSQENITNYQNLNKMENKQYSIDGESTFHIYRNWIIEAETKAKAITLFKVGKKGVKNIKCKQNGKNIQ
jgi:hypothetical protein